jgi:hypothetical protein
VNADGYSIVPKNKSQNASYPYVRVEDNGSFRELLAEEKQYLEEKFHPADGNRPYIKISFYSKTPDGKLGGFLKRSKLPKSLKLDTSAPSKPWCKFW